MLQRQITGFVGCCLLASSAWLASPWGLGFAGRSNSVPVRCAQTLPAIAGLVLLFWAWIGLRDLNVRRSWPTFAAWVAPLMASPALMSKDAWAYLEQGWIVLQGFNPYETPLSSIGGPFGADVDVYWRYTTTVYPPLALLIQAAMVALGGGHPLISLLLMRLPGLVSMIAIGVAIAVIARRNGRPQDRAVWFGLLNPLAIVTFIGGQHNDGWAIAFSLVGLALSVSVRRGGWILGCLLVGLGMAVKQPVGLMMVACCLAPIASAQSRPRDAWRDIIGSAWWRLVVALTATLAGFGAVTWLSGWGLGWATGSGAPFSTSSQSLAYLVVSSVAGVTGASLGGVGRIVYPIIMGIGIVTIAVLGWKLAAHKPIAFTAWGLVIFALSYPSLQPWYVLWGGMLFGLYHMARRWRIGIVVAIVYFLSTGVLLDYAAWPIPAAEFGALVIGLAQLPWLRRVIGVELVA